MSNQWRCMACSSDARVEAWSEKGTSEATHWKCPNCNRLYHLLAYPRPLHGIFKDAKEYGQKKIDTPKAGTYSAPDLTEARQTIKEKLYSAIERNPPSNTRGYFISSLPDFLQAMRRQQVRYRRSRINNALRDLFALARTGTVVKVP